MLTKVMPFCSYVRDTDTTGSLNDEYEVTCLVGCCSV
jgi:hypothetical protein